MKALEYIPSELQLQKAYDLIQSTPQEVSVQNLATWSQWARFDPRLAEIWITHLAKHWKMISPILFNESLVLLPWPTAAGPLLEHIHFFTEMSSSERALFRKWARCAMSGIFPKNHEQYFIGLRSFASSLIQKDALYTLKLYEQWGYYGRDILEALGRVVGIRQAEKDLKSHPRLKAFGNTKNRIYRKISRPKH